MSSGMAYCEELEAPATLDKGKWCSPRKELGFGGVKNVNLEETVTDRKPLELDEVCCMVMFFFFSVESSSSMCFLCLC